MLERYKLLFSRVRDIVLFIEKDGQIIEANQAAIAAYGYERQELLSLKIQDLRDAQTHANLTEQLARANNEGILFQTIHRRKDGSTFPVEVSSQGTGIGEKRVLLSIIRDISDRQIVEQQLKTQARQQEALAYLSQLALADNDINCLLDSAIKLVAQTLKIEYAAVWELLADGESLIVRAGIGWQTSIVGQVTDSGSDSQAGYTLLTKGPVIVEDWSRETRFSLPASMEQYGISSSMSVIIDNQNPPFGVLGAHTTKRRNFSNDDIHFMQAVANVLAIAIKRHRISSEQRFLVEASAILATSLDYQTTLENLAHLAVPHLADWCAVDMRGKDKTIERLVVVHKNPEKLEFARQLQQRYPPNPDAERGVARVLRTGESEFYPEIPDALLVASAIDAEHLEILRQFGFSSAMVVPLIARGRTLGAITFVSAESKRRYSASHLSLAEDVARRAALAVDNARLYRDAFEAETALSKRASELAQISNALAQTNVALEKRNQELDQFAYIVSHDLKAPLRAIANLSEWIEEDLQDNLTEDTEQQMYLLRSRVRRMEALIDGVLQYSRVGRLKSDAELVNVAGLLADTIDSLEPPPSFTITVQPGMPTLTTERLPLQQVFANLISNGIKHHDRKDGQLSISVVDKGDAYEFAVADDGPGIGPEYHDKVFGIFTTLKARDQVENTGVGLAIVKKIIDDKGGTIRLESQQGLGATFYFTWLKHS